MQEEKNNKYSAEYIRKYLDGQLSDQEMQALEKAALEDPFLADAIEGFEESRKHAVPFESGMADLKTKLAERISQRNRKRGILFQLSKWQVAATLFILLGSAVFTVTYINKRIRTVDIAVSPIKATVDSSVPAIVKSEPENIASDKNIPDNKMPVSPEKPTTRQKPVLTRRGKNLVRGDNEKDLVRRKLDSPIFNQRSEPLKKSSYDEREGNTSENPESAMAKRKDSILFPAPSVKESSSLLPEALLSGKASGVEISRDRRDNRNYVQGIVTDNFGKPIPFASVSIKGLKAAVSTDTGGYFKLYLKKSDSALQITVQSAGFYASSARLNTDSNNLNRIQMQPTSTSLNDVVVTGYGIKDEGGDYKGKKSGAEKTAGNKNVQPVTGWKLFYEYLNTDKKIVSADSLLKGEETVLFEVNIKGELSSFKIIKSVSPAHDEEIIRLIKAGPAWKIKKGKKQLCTVSLLFP